MTFIRIFIFKICNAEYQGEHLSLAKSTVSQNIPSLGYTVTANQEGIIHNGLGFQRKRRCLHPQIYLLGEFSKPCNGTVKTM